MGGSADPEDPQYQPTYNASAGQSAGSGRGFGADLYHLYAAGRKHFPELALEYATSSRHLDAGGEMTQAISTQVPYHRAYSRALDMMGAAQLAINDTSNVLDKTGEALIDVADTYVVTDQAALDAFNSYLDEDRSTYQDPVDDPGKLPKPDYDL